MTGRTLDISGYQALSDEDRTLQRLLGAHEIIAATEREVICVGDEPHELLAVGRIKEVQQDVSQESVAVKTWTASPSKPKKRRPRSQTTMSTDKAGRSVWKGPFVDAYVLKKAEAARNEGRNEVIKIWSRRSTILPQFVGLTFGVYNGKKHIPVKITEEMIGQKFGEYTPNDKTKGIAAKLRRLKASKKN